MMYAAGFADCAEWKRHLEHTFNHAEFYSRNLKDIIMTIFENEIYNMWNNIKI